MTGALGCTEFVVTWMADLRRWRASCDNCGWAELHEWKRVCTGAGFRHIGHPDRPKDPRDRRSRTD
jgi:hypothetical protein